MLKEYPQNSHSNDTEAAPQKHKPWLEIDPLEKELVQRAKEGDDDAFAAIAEIQTPFIRAIAFSMLNPHNIEDITQDVLIKIHQSLPRYQHKIPLSFWVRRITKNCVVSYLKRDSHKSNHTYLDYENSENLVANQDQDVHSAMENRLMVEKALEVLQTFKQKQREAVYCRIFEGLGHDEISELLGIPEGHIRVLIHRGRNQIKKALDDLRNEYSPSESYNSISS